MHTHTHTHTHTHAHTHTHTRTQTQTHTHTHTVQVSLIAVAGPFSFQLTSPYFVYNVKKHCREGEIFLKAMGYQQKPGTSEMLYSGSGGTATADQMQVAGTVVDLLVIVEMLNTLLEVRDELRQYRNKHDFETVFEEEFQEAFATSGKERNRPWTYACSGGEASGINLEQPPTATAKQQQWAERGMDSKIPGSLASHLPPVGDRVETTTDFRVEDLPRLYPARPPTAKQMPQPRASDPPAVQGPLKQTHMQTVNQDWDMHRMHPQVGQWQQLPSSPRMHHRASDPLTVHVQTVSQNRDTYGDHDAGMHHDMHPQVGQWQQSPSSPRMQHRASVPPHVRQPHMQTASHDQDMYGDSDAGMPQKMQHQGEQQQQMRLSPRMQHRASDPPAVQVSVRQPGTQTVSQGQDMYVNWDTAMQMPKVTSSPHHGAPQGSSKVTHIPSYAVEDPTSQLQACHLSERGVRNKGPPGALSHPSSRSCPSSASVPTAAQWNRVGMQCGRAGPPRASTGDHCINERVRLDLVKVDYHDDGDAEILSPADRPRERVYGNVNVLSRPSGPPRRHSHEMLASKSPVPTPRKDQPEPQAALHHSFTPHRPPVPQYANASPPVTAGYQSLGTTDEHYYTFPERPAPNRYQPLQGPIQADIYEPLTHTGSGRNPPMNQRSPHPPHMGSSGVGRHTGWEESSSHMVHQGHQLPVPPHHSGDRSYGRGSSHFGNPHGHIPTSKPHQLAVEYHHCDDSSGSGGQYSGEDYSRHGPSSDEEHSLKQTRL